MTRMLDAEIWLCSRMKDHGGMNVLDGVLSPEQRRDRIRNAILSNGLSTVLVGRKNGRGETYAACFERLYGEKLGKESEGQPTTTGEASC